MAVSHSSGLNLLLPLFFRLASPPSTNPTLVLPSLVWLIAAQSRISCLQTIPVGSDNIYIFTAREREWRKAEEDFWIPHLSGAALPSVRGSFKITIILTSPQPRPVLAYLIHAVHFLQNLNFLCLCLKNAGISPPVSMRLSSRRFCDKRRRTGAGQRSSLGDSRPRTEQQGSQHFQPRKARASPVPSVMRRRWRWGHPAQALSPWQQDTARPVHELHFLFL